MAFEVGYGLSTCSVSLLRSFLLAGVLLLFMRMHHEAFGAQLLEKQAIEKNEKEVDFFDPLKAMNGLTTEKNEKEVGFSNPQKETNGLTTASQTEEKEMKVEHPQKRKREENEEESEESNFGENNKEKEKRGRGRPKKIRSSMKQLHKAISKLEDAKMNMKFYNGLATALKKMREIDSSDEDEELTNTSTNMDDSVTEKEKQHAQKNPDKHDVKSEAQHGGDHLHNKEEEESSSTGASISDANKHEGEED